jgi:non-heme chloroperoxidase
MDMYVGETAAGSQGEIVPFEDAVLLQAKLVKRSSLKIYPAYPHGCLL